MMSHHSPLFLTMAAGITQSTVSFYRPKAVNSFARSNNRAAAHKGGRTFCAAPWTQPEEKLSATRPFSTGMPSFRGAELTERDMWGITPLDQLWCRIKFREARYDGHYTPPGLSPSVQFPGTQGGMEWSGVSFDPDRQIAIVNSNRMPMYTQLLTRSQENVRGLKRWVAQTIFHRNCLLKRARRMRDISFSLSVPCSQPPYGLLSAVHLATGKLIWTKPFGSARDLGPLGIRSRLPVSIGTFNIGGSVTTRGGVTFIAATYDRYLRAYEMATGKLLWRQSLPGAGHATPITYISPKSRRQIVVITANGNDGLGAPGNSYVVAFSLPSSPKESH
jgi:quinoprotein glucose dehydrogenase